MWQLMQSESFAACDAGSGFCSTDVAEATVAEADVTDAEVTEADDAVAGLLGKSEA
jgi:hypothetical protein